jgi:hypothetical protein
MKFPLALLRQLPLQNDLVDLQKFLGKEFPAALALLEPTNGRFIPQSAPSNSELLFERR